MSSWIEQSKMVPVGQRRFAVFGRETPSFAKGQTFFAQGRKFGAIAAKNGGEGLWNVMKFDLGESAEDLHRRGGLGGVASAECGKPPVLEEI